MTTASQLNQQVIEYGTLRGAFLWRNNTGRRGGVSFGKVGSGDVIGVYRGYFVSIETKTPSDRASKAQLMFAQDVREHGGFACFVRDLNDAVEFFNMIDNEVNHKGE